MTFNSNPRGRGFTVPAPLEDRTLPLPVVKTSAALPIMAAPADDGLTVEHRRVLDEITTLAAEARAQLTVWDRRSSDSDAAAAASMGQAIGLAKRLIEVSRPFHSGLVLEDTISAVDDDREAYEIRKGVRVRRDRRGPAGRAVGGRQQRPQPGPGAGGGGAADGSDPHVGGTAMILLAALSAVTVLAAFGLGYLTAKWRDLGRVTRAEDLSDAARGDADGLAEDLRALQEALAAGLPLDASQLTPPRMPRMEELFLEAAERSLRCRRPLPVRVRRSIRRAERAASQT